MFFCEGNELSGNGAEQDECSDDDSNKKGSRYARCEEKSPEAVIAHKSRMRTQTDDNSSTTRLLKYRRPLCSHTFFYLSLCIYALLVGIGRSSRKLFGILAFDVIL